MAEIGTTTPWAHCIPAAWAFLQPAPLPETSTSCAHAVGRAEARGWGLYIGWDAAGQGQGYAGVCVPLQVEPG